MFTRNLLALTLAAAVMVAGGVACADGDPEKGEKIFKKCKVCHSLEAGKNKQGPSLHGVIGRTSGTAEGFKKYSDAMQEAAIVWDETTINEYLADPKGYIPKNKMAFRGLKKEQDRLDVIAYIKHESEEGEDD